VIKLDWNIFWIIFNILVLFFLLRIFLFKPLNNIAAKRTELVQSEITSAEEKNKKAGELKDQYEKSLSNAKEESAQIVGSAKERAQVQYDQIVEKANADAAQIVSQAHKTAELDYEQTMRGARSELADVAMAAAIKLIGESVNDESNKALLDRYLAEEGQNR
jgi:F-type H+-transporting ATPase subunit b